MVDGCLGEQARYRVKIPGFRFASSGLRALPIMYQLIHRTASALLEAERFRAGHALMLVHSFSQEHKWFEDYAAFAALYGREVSPDSIVCAGSVNNRQLYLGWVTGERAYLDR